MGVYVVGVDGSPTAAKAAERAGELAAATGAAMHVVCAHAGRGATRVDAGSETYVVSAFDEAEQVAQQQAAVYRVAGLTVTIAVCEAKPAAAIVAEAEKHGAELIVVGNRRMHGVSRVLGAVGTEILRHAPCDVLVVRTT